MSDSGYSSYSEGGGPNYTLIGGIVVVLLIGLGVAVFHFKVFGASSMLLLCENINMFVLKLTTLLL